MEYTVLLDAPDQPTRRIPIARLGEYSDKRYGDFAITHSDYEQWQRNLSKLPGGQALIDLEHRSERKPRDSAAAGWISGLSLEGDQVWGDVNWTPLGEEKVKSGEYRFISPTFGPYTNDRGETFENTLQSAALTNKPFLTSMPAICLASEERVSEAVTSELTTLLERQLDLVNDGVTLTGQQTKHLTELVAALTPKPTADSRPATMERAQLLKTLDLAENASDQAITEALSGLKAEAGKAKKLEKDLTKKPVKTLEAQAQEAGLVLLDRDSVTQLQAQAAAGAEASRQLKEQRFETAFTLALEDSRGPRVTPAEKDTLKHFYTLDADATIKLIEERDPIAPAKPQGTPIIDLSQDTPEVNPQAAVEAGYQPQSVQLDAQIHAHMRAQNMPNTPENYVKVLEQVASGSLRI